MQYVYYTIYFANKHTKGLDEMKKYMIVLLTLCVLLQGVMAIAEEPVYFGPFEAENLRGDAPVTDAVFAEADVTIVNLWATWCGPCVQEMPDLAKLSEMSEGRVQVISVLLDAFVYENSAVKSDEDAIATMHALLDQCEATFPALFPDDAFFIPLSSVVQAIPTSFIIDSEGYLMGTYVGSRSAEQWLSVAEEALAIIDAKK